MKSSILTALLGLHLTSAFAAVPPSINDRANFFSPEAQKLAKERIVKIQKAFKKKVFIETVEELPLSDISAQTRHADSAFVNWATSRLSAAGANNLYIVIGRNPSYVMATVGTETKRRGEFTEQDRDFLIKLIADNFDQRSYDKGLLEGLDFIGTTFHNFQMGRPNQYRTIATAPQGADDVALVWRWIGFGCAGLLAVLMISGLIRGFKDLPPPAKENLPA